MLYNIPVYEHVKPIEEVTLDIHDFFVIKQKCTQSLCMLRRALLWDSANHIIPHCTTPHKVSLDVCSGNTAQLPCFTV